MKLQEAFSPEESEKIYANFLAIVNDSKRRDKLVRKHGANAENVAYGTAVNQVKKQAANKIEEPMDKEQRLKEMVKAALSKPLTEKLKPSMGAGAYVDDFRTSKAPQFKGKSKKKKNKMAVAAYLSAKNKIKEAILAKIKNR